MILTWLYVGALYALAVFLGRRAGADLRWRIAALFYGLVLLFLFRPMTQAYVNLPVDFLQTLPPWTHTTRAHAVYNHELNDLTLQIVPWAHQVREGWKALHVPLWNALSGSGYPLVGNGQSAAFSPLRLLSLPLPLGYAFTAEAAMKLLIALTFMFLYGRRRGWSETAAAVGAVSFGFCTFLTTWLHFPLATAACVLPAVFYALELLVERITYRRFVLACAVWAVMLFGGHPETAAHVFFLALLNIAWVLAVERRFETVREAWRFLLAAGGALALAAVIASPQLAPVAEGLKRSKRFQELQVQPNAIGYYSDYPSQVILIQPHFYGVVPLEKAWGPAHAESITGFAGILGVAAWFAMLGHTIATRRFRSREFFFVVATPVVLGVMLGWPVISTIFHAVFSLAANARLRLLLCFVLAVQAAAVADVLERERPRNVLAGLAAAAVILLYLMNGWMPGGDWQRDTAMIAMIPSLFVLLVAAVAPLVPARERPFALILLVAAVVNELWAVGSVWNPVVPERLMYPKTPLIEKLEALRAQAKAPFRIVATGPLFFPNSPAIYGFEDIRAHDPMSNGHYLGLLRVLTGYDTTDYFAKWENLETRMLDYLNVRYVVAPPKFEMKDRQRYPLVYDGRDGRIFENRDVLPRFFVAQNVLLEFRRDPFVRRLIAEKDFAHTAVMRRLPVENDRERTDLLAPRPPGAPQATAVFTRVSDSEYLVRVNAPRYTLVVSSIPWWPGWRVERNGERSETLEANGAFVAFVARPGVSIVRVTFDPLSFRLSAALSLLAIATLAVLSRESLRSRLRAAPRSG